MNKLVKLPLFLGIVGGVCAGVLAGVNALTAPIIEQAAKEKAFAAYIETYSSFNVTANDIELIESGLPTGCTAKAVIVNDSVKGVAYTCVAKGGYGGDINFQVAFANGEYLGYTDLGHGETPGFGADLIKKFPTLLKGISSNDALLSNSTYADAIKGSSITGKAVANAIELCRVDYVAWYEANK